LISDAKGLSLIEIMVASLVFSLAAAFGMRFLVLQHGWVILQEDMAESQQQARTALDLMGRELSLLGFGVPDSAAPVLKATEQEIEFLANVEKEMTHLTEEAGVGQTVLRVNGGEFESGEDFEEGKTVSICSSGRCEWHTLAKDGGRDALELSDALQGFFPVGSTVQRMNRIRYALKPAGSMQFKLIRTVDGGANPVAEGLASMQLDYRDETGGPAMALENIHRIGIRIAVRMARTPDKIRSLMTEAYLRNR
jgi:prepilin-type N-terminal cleavage/methylation domain-containing protein